MNDWLDDFKRFLEQSDKIPPAPLSHSVRSRITADLNPSGARVMLKLAMVLAITAPFSLMLCPQFGFSLIRESHGLMRFFMQHGIYLCALFCGAVFVGVAGIAAGAILKPEEIRALRRLRYLQLAFLSLLSLSGFICFGADVLLSLALLWLLGAFLASVLTLEAIFWLRGRSPLIVP